MAISPRLIDTLRDGTAPAVIRRKGAAGNLPVPLNEKIEILVFLAGDHAPEISQRALASLLDWPAGELEPVLADPSTPAQVLEFVTNHLTAARPELVPPLRKNPALPEVARAAIESKGFGSEPSAPAVEAAPEPAESAPEKRQNLLQKISRMSTPEKVRLALLGNQEERLILVRDSNRIVARAVLQSPKLTDGEIEAIASMKTVTEEILRLIALNRGFMKKYGVIYALVNNPKTPIDVSLPLLNRLNDRDLKTLMINKNVPDVIRTVSTNMVKKKEEAQRASVPLKKH